MENDRKGALARSKAGHDAGKVYMIVETDEVYAYLADGSIRTRENPKKKKWKHLQLIRSAYPADTLDDAEIRRIIKMYNREES